LREGWSVAKRRAAKRFRFEAACCSLHEAVRDAASVATVPGGIARRQTSLGVIGQCKNREC
jgi:hypothetical protein